LICIAIRRLGKIARRAVKVRYFEETDTLYIEFKATGIVETRNLDENKAADEWSDEFRACLGAWPGRIPRPEQKRVRDLRDPFA
jgi:hypothetical protein